MKDVDDIVSTLGWRAVSMGFHRGSPRGTDVHGQTLTWPVNPNDQEAVAKFCNRWTELTSKPRVGVEYFQLFCYYLGLSRPYTVPEIKEAMDRMVVEHPCSMTEDWKKFKEDRYHGRVQPGSLWT